MERFQKKESASRNFLSTFQLNNETFEKTSIVCEKTKDKDSQKLRFIHG